MEVLTYLTGLGSKNAVALGFLPFFFVCLFCMSKGSFRLFDNEFPSLQNEQHAVFSPQETSLNKY